MNTTTEVKITGIDVHAYLVKDPARAIAFYRDVLGLPTAREMPQGAEFDLADGATFGVWQMDDGSWHPSAGVMFAVPDVHRAVDQFKERGLKVLFGPFENEDCFMASCEDTEGNSFLLHQRKPHAA
jgi:predicted enzyme related to lactoylglutathione lyase